jgi:hypothetical protein
MQCQIDYFSSQWGWSDVAIQDFAMAKDMAKKAVVDGIAERVEIRDGDGHLLYHFPRVTRRA